MAAAAQALRDPGPEVVLTPVGFPSRAVRWGRCWQVGTAAYWIALTGTAIQDGRVPDSPARHRIDADLSEQPKAEQVPIRAGLALSGQPARHPHARRARQV
jgi:hypothetical protein